MKRLFAVVIAFLPLVSCVSVHIKNILDDVETYISERPDSALAVLDSIERNLLKTQKLKSHHALLHAMALDKNFIDVSDDSLALTALEYYERHGDRKYKARALYYLGLSYYYSQEYDKAIIEFTKAEEVAQKHDSLYWGMTKVAQADTYNKTYNSIEEMNCIVDARRILHNISQYHYYVAELRLAQVYTDLNRFDKSNELYEKLINVDDDVISFRALRSFAYLNALNPNGDFTYPVKLYERILSEYSGDYMTLKDYWAFAYSLSKSNRQEEAEEIVNQLVLIDTSITSDYWQYILAKLNTDYKAALFHLERVTEKNEEEVAGALKQELSIKQRDYYAVRSELAMYKMGVKTLIFSVTILLLIMIIGYILIFIIRYKKSRQDEINKHIEYIAEITRQLDEVKTEGINSLKKKYLELYKSKFEVLKSLSDQYLQTENRVDAEKIIYKKVVSLVDEIRNDAEHRAGFEAMLDNDLDGIMTNFRKELPKLKEIDYAIFSYWIAGFDVTTISRLLDTSLNIVYIRKTRIKQHIKDRAPEHMDQFLEMIA